MNASISNPAECEVRGVIRFWQAENVRPSEIHRRLVAVYGEHVLKAASKLVSRYDKCLNVKVTMWRSR